MSNSLRVKEWRKQKRKPCPDGCGTEVAHDTIRCRGCWAVFKRKTATDKTVAELKATTKSARWTDHLRYFARSEWANHQDFQKCVVCGYDKHVEIAHIIDVVVFPEDTKISYINRRENLLALCPNHHWEFDDGLLLPSECGRPDIYFVLGKTKLR